MAKSKQRKVKKKTKQQLIARLKKEIIGISYCWTDSNVVGFLNNGNTAEDYVIDPKTVKFSHSNAQYRAHARYLFTEAKRLLSNYIPLSWVISIRVEFENGDGEIFGSESEGAARATFSDLAEWVTEQIHEAVERSQEASKGKLGQLSFKQAHFNVHCEGP